MAETDTFGGYQLSKPDSSGDPITLDRGPGGLTSLAFDPKSGRLVEIHQLDITGDEAIAFRPSLDEGVITLRNTYHPSLARLLYCGIEDKQLFYVCDFVDGEPIDEYVKRVEGVGKAIAMELAVDLIDALYLLEPSPSLLAGTCLNHLTVAERHGLQPRLRISRFAFKADANDESSERLHLRKAGEILSVLHLLSCGETINFDDELNSGKEGKMSSLLAGILSEMLEQRQGDESILLSLRRAIIDRLASHEQFAAGDSNRCSPRPLSVLAQYLPDESSLPAEIRGQYTLGNTTLAESVACLPITNNKSLEECFVHLPLPSSIADLSEFKPATLAASTSDCPHLLATISSIETDGGSYVVEQRPHGFSLSQLFNARRGLSAEETHLILQQIEVALKALDALEDHVFVRLVPRDIFICFDPAKASQPEELLKEVLPAYWPDFEIKIRARFTLPCLCERLDEEFPRQDHDFLEDEDRSTIDRQFAALAAAVMRRTHGEECDQAAHAQAELFKDSECRDMKSIVEWLLKESFKGEDTIDAPSNQPHSSNGFDGPTLSIEEIKQVSRTIHSLMAGNSESTIDQPANKPKQDTNMDPINEKNATPEQEAAENVTSNHAASEKADFETPTDPFCADPGSKPVAKSQSSLKPIASAKAAPESPFPVSTCTKPPGSSPFDTVGGAQTQVEETNGAAEPPVAPIANRETAPQQSEPHPDLVAQTSEAPVPDPSKPSSPPPLPSDIESPADAPANNNAAEPSAKSKEETEDPTPPPIPPSAEVAASATANEPTMDAPTPPPIDAHSPPPIPKAAAEPVEGKEADPEATSKTEGVAATTEPAIASAESESDSQSETETEAEGDPAAESPATAENQDQNREPVEVEVEVKVPAPEPEPAVAAAAAAAPGKQDEEFVPFRTVEPADAQSEAKVEVPAPEPAPEPAAATAKSTVKPDQEFTPFQAADPADAKSSDAKVEVPAAAAEVKLAKSDQEFTPFQVAEPADAKSSDAKAEVPAPEPAPEPAAAAEVKLAKSDQEFTPFRAAEPADAKSSDAKVEVPAPEPAPEPAAAAAEEKPAKPDQEFTPFRAAEPADAKSDAKVEVPAPEPAPEPAAAAAEEITAKPDQEFTPFRAAEPADAKSDAKVEVPAPEPAPEPAAAAAAAEEKPAKPDQEFTPFQAAEPADAKSDAKVEVPAPEPAPEPAAAAAEEITAKSDQEFTPFRAAKPADAKSDAKVEVPVPKPAPEPAAAAEEKPGEQTQDDDPFQAAESAGVKSEAKVEAPGTPAQQAAPATAQNNPAPVFPQPPSPFAPIGDKASSVQPAPAPATFPQAFAKPVAASKSPEEKASGPETPPKQQNAQPSPGVFAPAKQGIPASFAGPASPAASTAGKQDSAQATPGEQQAAENAQQVAKEKKTKGRPKWLSSLPVDKLDKFLKRKKDASQDSKQDPAREDPKQPKQAKKAKQPKQPKQAKQAKQKAAAPAPAQSNQPAEKNKPAKDDGSRETKPAAAPKEKAEPAVAARAMQPAQATEPQKAGAGAKGFAWGRKENSDGKMQFQLPPGARWIGLSAVAAVMGTVAWLVFGGSDEEEQTSGGGAAAAPKQVVKIKPAKSKKIPKSGAPKSKLVNQEPEPPTSPVSIPAPPSSAKKPDPVRTPTPPPIKADPPAVAPAPVVTTPVKTPVQNTPPAPAAKTGPNPDQALLTWVDKLIQRKNFEGAMDNLEELQNEYPGSSKVRSRIDTTLLGILSENKPLPANAVAIVEARASQGETDMMQMLANHHMDKNPGLAHEWLGKLATANGDVEAMEELSAYYMKANPDLAYDWLAKVADKTEDVGHMKSLSRHFMTRDTVQSYRWLTRVAEKTEDLESMRKLASYYEKSDPDTSHQWLARVANKGNDVQAMAKLSKFFMQSDPPQAYEWLGRAAKTTKDVAVMKQLGMRFGTASSDLHDPTASITWLQSAADLNDPEAWYLLGEQYLNGDASIADPRKAAECYKKAVHLGYRPE